eukprot:GCRY01004849.1.p1 GENE.GCRY01004849.1~~GCRY01004849.1.p1  ORF type:complete len:196 (-),score=25.84 GCRY01004849.1:85-672(-)
MSLSDEEAFSDEQSDLSADELLDADEDPELVALREQRLDQLKSEYSNYHERVASGYGQFLEVTQDDFLKHVTNSDLVVCHFYHEEFVRCKIMDMHLGILAPKYFGTKFIKINAQKAAFFVAKLQIKVLPTVVCFKKGIAEKRLVGFEGLGSDNFPTHALENWLASAGMIQMPKKQNPSIFGYLNPDERLSDSDSD